MQQLQHARAPFSWQEVWPRARARRPYPTPDGKVTAISFGGHDPECCEEAKDALTFPASSAVGCLLHVPRATLHGEVHNTSREAACILVRRKES